jgi:hypothetical protein
VFKSAANAFSLVGMSMCNADSDGSQQLFFEGALPRIAPLLGAQPTKRGALCECFYSFVAPTVGGHIGALKKLQTTLDNGPAFIHALTALVFLEDESLFDAELLDLYVYYALIGLGETSPSIRSGSVAMLSVLLANGAMGEMHQFLDTLKSLAAEDTYVRESGASARA